MHEHIVFMDRQANQPLNYPWITLDCQFINIPFRLFKFILPIEPPSIFLSEYFYILNFDKGYLCAEAIATYNVFYRIRKFIYLKIKEYWPLSFHYINLPKLALLAKS